MALVAATLGGRDQWFDMRPFIVGQVTRISQFAAVITSSPSTSVVPLSNQVTTFHVEVREVMNGIMYILSTGCQWRAIPKDLPPRSTLFDYLDLWSYDGTLDRIHHALCGVSGARRTRSQPDRRHRR